MYMKLLLLLLQLIGDLVVVVVAIAVSGIGVLNHLQYCLAQQNEKTPPQRTNI